MSTRRIIELALAAVGLTVLSGSSCDNDLLHDPGMDMWCGEQLCSWTTEYGEVRKVATWHEMDEGAQLRAPATAMSQLAWIDQHDADCIRFSLLADRDDDARLYLEIDFDDDGVLEYSHEIPSDDFELATFHVETPGTYEGVRFRVRSQGWGHAVVAQIRAEGVASGNCNPEWYDTYDDSFLPTDTGF